MPVSYTHLDVYKRQLITPSSVLTHSVIKSCLYKNIAPIIEPPIRNGSHFLVAIAPMTIPITIITAIRPVSYTHLLEQGN